MPQITYTELEALPTLSVGQAADLKIDTGTIRVWVSRCGFRDGETVPVQIEMLVDGRWEDVTPERRGYTMLDGEWAGVFVETYRRVLAS